MSVDHIRQKLWEAINSLVRDGSIQDRLYYASNSLVQLAPDELDQLPGEMRARFDEVRHTLTKHPAEREGEGAIRASVRKLTPDEGTQIAQEIVSIYVGLRGGI